MGFSFILSFPLRLHPYSKHTHSIGAKRKLRTPFLLSWWDSSSKLRNRRVRAVGGLAQFNEHYLSVLTFKPAQAHFLNWGLSMINCNSAFARRLVKVNFDVDDLRKSATWLIRSQQIVDNVCELAVTTVAKITPTNKILQTLKDDESDERIWALCVVSIDGIHKVLQMRLREAPFTPFMGNIDHTLLCMVNIQCIHMGSILYTLLFMGNIQCLYTGVRSTWKNILYILLYMRNESS